MNTRLWAVIRKEFIHILRDPRTLVIMFLIPIVELFILGYAVTNDVPHIDMAVFDADKTMQSRQLIEAYRASNYFTITNYAASQDEIGAMLASGAARAGLVIPSGYGDNLARGTTAQVAVLIDGSDPTVANTAFAASQSIGQAQSMQIVSRRMGIDVTKISGVEVRPRVWYNPEMKSSNYMVPAVMGLILQFLTTLFTALTIVREREQGTIEQLVVTPVKAWELVVGKVVPYVVIAFFDMIEVLVLGVVLFGVPIRGDLGLLLALSTLFFLASLGMGLFVSSVAKSQLEAMFLAMLTLLPSMFIGGFLFPIESMPGWLQALSLLVPLRYLLIIIRSIMLKGAGVEALASPILALVILCPLIMFGAATRFRKSLE